MEVYFVPSRQEFYLLISSTVLSIDFSVFMPVLRTKGSLDKHASLISGKLLNSPDPIFINGTPKLTTLSIAGIENGVEIK